jgi:TRAP-type C4-dicarboxylate transport system permease small subunit
VTMSRPHAVRRGLDRFYTGCGIAAGVSLVAIAVFVLIQIIARILGVVITWTAEFSGYAMASSSFLGLVYTFNTGGHIRVDLVLGWLPARPRRWVEILCLAMGLAVVGFFAWHSIVMTWQSYVLHDVGQGSIAVPLWIPQTIMSLGVLALAIALLDNLVRYVAWGTTAYPRSTSHHSVA